MRQWPALEDRIVPLEGWQCFWENRRSRGSGAPAGRIASYSRSLEFDSRRWFSPLAYRWAAAGLQPRLGRVRSLVRQQMAGGKTSPPPAG